MSAAGSCGSHRTGSCQGRLSTPAANQRAQGSYNSLTPQQERVAKHLLTSRAHSPNTLSAILHLYLQPSTTSNNPPMHLIYLLFVPPNRADPAGKAAGARRPSTAPVMSSPSALLIALEVIWHPKTLNGRFGVGGRNGLEGGCRAVTQVHKLTASHVANEQKCWP